MLAVGGGAANSDHPTLVSAFLPHWEGHHIELYGLREGDDGCRTLASHPIWQRCVFVSMYSRGQ